MSPAAPASAHSGTGFEAAPHPAQFASDPVFAAAADLFALLATPIRLKIISAVCFEERSVSQLVAHIGTTQPNVSQHLAVLLQAGVLARRRLGNQMLYRLHSERVGLLCRSVCTQVAIDLDGTAPP